MDDSIKINLAIDFLYDFADQLLAGERLQITKLMKIYRLVENYGHMQRLFIGMLHYVGEKPRAPANLYPVVSIDKKRQLICALLDILQSSTPDHHAAKLIDDEVKCFCAGTKRFSVHSSGFMYSDSDLLMLSHIGSAIHCGREVRWCSYAAARAFCCDYKNMRFAPDRDSAERVCWIADHFAMEHLVSI